MAPDIPSLEYGCSEWRKSSQTASNLYEQGVKLWSRADLQDIEQQLAQSMDLEYFTVNLIDGKKARIKNPMFAEQLPIWQPLVKYQEYWRLVASQPEGSPDTYHCSYLVHWENVCAKRFRGITKNADAIFEKNALAWNKSTSCRLLRSQLKAVFNVKKISKIICFGLGDMYRQPPEWFKRQTGSSEQELEADSLRPSAVQHSIALTMADIYSEKNTIQLLAQDPGYTEEAQQLLKAKGFSIVGRFGAGGFAEIDDDSVVFSAYIAAPLKQIIADVARPALIITTEFSTFNDSGKPWADPESPRTKAMWNEYERFDFPASPEDEEMLKSVRKLYIYIRKGA